MKYFNKNYSQLIIAILFFSFQAKAQVWPADANNNGIVNNVDFIFTGVAFETGGPSRLGVDQGIDWNPKPSSDWTNSFNQIGVNYKHADANGDGWIDGGDLFSVNDYYDTTNINFNGTMGNYLPGNDLYLTFSDTVIESGDTITIKINLGSATNPINNIHGIAFSIGFDTSRIKEYETTIDFHGGWLGTPNVDLFTLAKYDENIDIERADFAATRTWNGVVSGYGEIGEIVVIIEDDLIGKKSQIIGAINFNFQNVLGLDSLAFDMNITSKNDSIDIDDGIVAIEESQENEFLSIYPNPVKTILKIKSSYEVEKVQLVDLLGKNVETIFQNNSINVEHLQNGIYYFRIKTKYFTRTERVLINR